MLTNSVLAKIWRLFLAITGFLIMTAVLLFGLLIGITLYFWHRMRGKPTPGIRIYHSARSSARNWHSPNTSQRGRQEVDDIVDVDAREIPAQHSSKKDHGGTNSLPAA